MVPGTTSPRCPGTRTVQQLLLMLHCVLAGCSAVYCNRSCLCVCVFVCGGRAVSEPYYSQRACSVCVSERFFHCYCFCSTKHKQWNSCYLSSQDFVHERVHVFAIESVFESCHLVDTATQRPHIWLQSKQASKFIRQKQYYDNINTKCKQYKSFHRAGRL